ncbi:MAG: DEAD/DEAH box helicase [Bacteroidales bacterium]|jgi:ATP-dependent RNA helicase DeaD|nr:DEAD/DEAH box helicase [Bacteroidales bacterium]
MEFFKDGALAPEVLKAIQDLGFEKPTEIQSAAIPYLLGNRRDLIALAQTGTGKTAAFGLPIISQIDYAHVVPQMLVICPTRELCMQIEKDLRNFGAYLPLKTVAVYGGASIRDQFRAIERGVHVVVATPGRLVDIIERKRIDLSNVRDVVLDESDEMLNMGFQESIDTILEQTPENKRTLLFSATMPKEVRRIASNYMINPEEITIGTKNSGATTVLHHAYVVQSKDRYTALKRIADFYPDIYGIVFCRTRQETKDIADKLMADGYNADALHGDLSQAQRDYVMKKFRSKNLQILVATDVAARGLDVQNLTHVINFSIPDDIETYTHRSGRTGRAGREGISIAICNLREKGKLRAIERLIQRNFEYKQVPGGKEICEIQMHHLIEKIKAVEVDEDKIGSFMFTVNQAFEGMSKEDLIRHFVSFEFNRMIQYYEGAKDINVHGNAPDEGDSKKSRRRDRDERGGREREGRDRGDRNDRRDRNDNTENRKQRREREYGNDRDERGARTSGSSGDYTRFFINVGKKEDFDKSKMLRLLNENLNDRDIRFGAIDILKSFSFFEVDSRFTGKVLHSLAGANYEGRTISVEVAQAPQGKAARGSKNDFIKGDDFFKNRNKEKERGTGAFRSERGNGSGRRNKHSGGGGRKRY